MFRHRGKTRTLKHNLRIASLLSFVAGIVNIAGFVAIQKLTTNVTGHFAFFIDELFKFNFWQGLVYFLYIFFFFLGSFVSNFLVELISKKKNWHAYIVPTFIECVILYSVAFLGQFLIHNHQNIMAFCLLFAMGLQNSLVTTISNATVRTTHLTGLFTDIGIELSQLFFYTQTDQRKKLISSIKLRLTIISFFFLGGLVGGVFYSFIQLYVLAFAATMLLLAVMYDYVKLKVILINRKYSKKNVKY
jgi:uncharacterized membrane protein YoaK (UPF0700 family)